MLVELEEQNNLDTCIHSEFHYTDKSKRQVFESYKLQFHSDRDGPGRTEPWEMSA